ncbi:MAG: (2Fe-2S) ferredoxin domain-containing protein [Planctomycetota bacterium]
MAKFQKHIFICVNERDAGDERGCCAARGGQDVASAFKKKLYARGLKRLVRPNKAQCLDQCSHGVAVVVYPDAVWYGGVTESDVDQIIDQHILGGEPVARLVIPDHELTGREPDAQTDSKSCGGEQRQ